MSSFYLKVLDRVCEEDVDFVNRMLAQLSENIYVVDADRLREIVENNNLLFGYYSENGDSDECLLVGMVTFSVCDLPTGRRGCVDDVVVDDKFRGKGLGRMMIEAVVEYAMQMECDSIFLTSNPKRIAANALYVKCGFERKETNVYTMKM